MAKNIQLQNCQAIIDGSRDSFLLFNLEQQQIVEANKAVFDSFGYTHDDLLTMPLSKLFNKISQEQLNDIFKDLLAGEGQTKELQTVFRANSGEKIPVNVRLNIIDDNGSSTVVIVATDIRLLNATMMSQLASVNQELEDFSYSISHDLRAPLRSIDGFAEALQEEYKNVLDKTGLDYLQRVIAGAERMGRLIDDLLALSRITRTEIIKSDVNLSLLAEEAIETLSLRNPGRKLTYNIKENITGNCDQVLIGVVISNLINNAWKYSQKKNHINIEFGVKHENDQTTYYLKDNGVGFSMQYADKIFSAFQRLHSAKDYDGAGIGLATVQRIIHRHGGHIWVESEPDQGATFYFTLQ